MNKWIETSYGDPLSPPPPVEPYRDPESEAWVLSRYADVLAAFREPSLRMGGGRNKDSPEIMVAMFCGNLEVLMIAPTATGSVGEMRAPNKKQ